MPGDINKSYQWAINTCNAPNVGYSTTYRNQQTINGITYYDCSSFIWFALIAGGFDCVAAHDGSTWPMTTTDEATVLQNLGFTQVDINGEWLPGDICLRYSHTEMVYTGGTASGVTMGAHTDRYELDKQVAINGYTSNAGNWSSIWRYGAGGAIGYGVSAYVIAAICGNWWQESGINPGIWENLTVGAPGYGLGQWTDNFETDRKTKLFAWLDSNGYAHDDGNAQLAFFIEENVWYKNGYATGYDDLKSFLQSTDTDLTALTMAFMEGWEGILDGTQDIRITQAGKVYDFILAHANDTTITKWYSGNYYSPDNERYNNAVMVYRYLSAGGGGGGIPGRKKKGMPLWMKIRYF